jgi:hypothetical protein
MVALASPTLNESYVEPSPYSWLRSRTPVPTSYAPACAPLYPFQGVLENRTSRARGMTGSCAEVVERTFAICIEIWQFELESCVWRVSFHKYAYVHGDPVQNIDPTGLFSLGGFMASIAIGGFNDTGKGAADLGALGYANFSFRWFRVLQNLYTVMARAYDAYELATSILEFLDFDMEDFNELKSKIGELGSYLGSSPTNATGANAMASSGFGPNQGTPSGGVSAAFQTSLSIPSRKRGRVAQLLYRAEELGVLNLIQERLGELVTGAAAEYLLGFKRTTLRLNDGPQGIDQLSRHSITGVWGVFEAKGGSSRLGTAQYGPGGKEVQQMSGYWINYWLDRTINDDRNFANPERGLLRTARRSPAPMAAVVTRFNNETSSYQIRVTAQLHFPLMPHLLDTWPRGT